MARGRGRHTEDAVSQVRVLLQRFFKKNKEVLGLFQTRSAAMSIEDMGRFAHDFSRSIMRYHKAQPRTFELFWQALASILKIKKTSSEFKNNLRDCYYFEVEERHSHKRIIALMANVEGPGSSPAAKSEGETSVDGSHPSGDNLSCKSLDRTPDVLDRSEKTDPFEQSYGFPTFQPAGEKSNACFTKHTIALENLVLHLEENVAALDGPQVPLSGEGSPFEDSEVECRRYLPSNTEKTDRCDSNDSVASEHVAVQYDQPHHTLSTGLMLSGNSKLDPFATLRPWVFK